MRDDLTAGRAQMRHGLDLLNIVAFEGLFKGAFAVAEARAGNYPAALATLDHAASVIERTGERWFDAELHRTRGEILVKQNPADPAPAEAAFLTAIAVAQQQKARSFELRAASRRRCACRTRAGAGTLLADAGIFAACFVHRRRRLGITNHRHRSRFHPSLITILVIPLLITAFDLHV